VRGPGGAAQSRDVHPAEDVRETLEPGERPVDEAKGTDAVAPLEVDTRHRDLDDALPEVPVARRCRAPGVLEELVGLEVAALVPAAHADGQRLLDTRRLGRLDEEHVLRAVRQGATRPVARTRLLRTSVLAPVARRSSFVRHPDPLLRARRVTRPAHYPRGVPELPEVESVRRQLAPAVTGRTIVATERDPYPARRIGDVDRATGGRIADVHRRGKFLLLPLEGAAPAHPSELVIHLGMTGILRVLDEHDPQSHIGTPSTHVRVRLLLDDGTVLILKDARRFGRVTVVDPGDHARAAPALAHLGPEPLSDAFTVEGLADGLARSQASVKSRLLDQRLVAGVGNIYADESLWRAGIHPDARRVGRTRASRLHAAVREVLAAAVEREGTTFRDYQLVNGQSGRYLTELAVYGRAGQPCRRCGTTLLASVVAQRGTTHCPRCQRR